MKAIRVKYMPPTASGRGSRWRATAEGVKPLSLPYDHEHDWAGNALKAAAALCERMGWTGTVATGQLPDGSWVFCFVEGGRWAVPGCTPL